MNIKNIILRSPIYAVMIFMLCNTGPVNAMKLPNNFSSPLIQETIENIAESESWTSFCKFLCHIAAEVNSCESYKKENGYTFTARIPTCSGIVKASLILGIVYLLWSMFLAEDPNANHSYYDPSALQHTLQSYPNWSGLKCNHSQAICNAANLYLETKPAYVSKYPKAKIAIVTLSTPERNRSFVDITQKRLKEYAEQWKYQYVQYDRSLDSTRPEEWSKIIAVARHLASHDWILWMDDDTYITNPSLSLEQIIQRYGNADLIVGKDPVYGTIFKHNDRKEVKITFNNGVFLIRNSPWAQNFLKEVWNMGQVWDYLQRGESLLEQQTMNNLVTIIPEHSEHTQIIEPGQLQSFITCAECEINRSPKFIWQPGDFIAHVGPDEIRPNVINVLEKNNDKPIEISSIICPDHHNGELKLSGQQLTTMPDVICMLTYLKHLDLSNNKISHIPDCISTLGNLEILDLSNNQLTSLPNSIALLKNLKRLDVSNNEISHTPDCISTLENLEILDLSNNQLTSLPNSIALLKNLKRLDVSNNEISHILDCISTLENLEILDLSNNQLTSLPNSIGLLKNLQIFLLNFNKLSALPPSIENLANLYYLAIDQNLDLDQDSLKSKIEHLFISIHLNEPIKNNGAP